MFRLWPGSQRLLLWGDPALAAEYGRASHFQGAAGVEICEPLFFKGRQGSGLPGGRCAYADESLKPRYDFEKYLYTYRVWGRLLYNPDAEPETWRRFLSAEFGAGAGDVEAAVAHGSRVLPIFTTTRLPSASNLGCWPEIYTNMPIVEGSEPSPYADTVVPKRLGTVSPLDPQLFSAVEEYTAELLGAGRSGKYSPVEVAQWLEDTSAAAMNSLRAAVARVPARRSAEFRRVEEDVTIQAGMAQFFAMQIRSAVLFDLYQRTGDREAWKAAVSAYRKARNAWAQMAEQAAQVYRADVTFGDAPVRRGHWKDRLPGIDKDFAAMEAYAKPPGSAVTSASATIRQALSRPMRPVLPCTHTVPASFRRGQPVALSLKTAATAAWLYYRHVDQAERWQKVMMAVVDGPVFSGAIPGEYSDSAFALEYYFVLTHGQGDRERSETWMYPGFDIAMPRQPYFTINAISRG